MLKRQPLDSYTALAAVTHDPKIDDFALKAALDANCFYVGALGSRKTHAKRVERLLALGATADQIARIHAPIGLDIGAASPAEIAVAVLAQAIQAFRSRGLECKGRGGVKFGPVPIDTGRRRGAGARHHGRRTALSQGASAERRRCVVAQGRRD